MACSPAAALPPLNCGKATFLNFPEIQRADGNPPVLPLPWNPLYLLAWDDFLINLNARYNSNPAFVSISIAGPTCASNEMILPTTDNGSTQASGLPADQAWQILIHHSFPLRAGYENSDQVFIDAGKQAIDAYEAIFSGITIFSNPDAANDFPEQPYPVVVHPDNTLYAVDCSTGSLFRGHATEVGRPGALRRNSACGDTTDATERIEGAIPHLRPKCGAEPNQRRT